MKLDRRPARYAEGGFLKQRPRARVRGDLPTSTPPAAPPPSPPRLGRARRAIGVVAAIAGGSIAFVLAAAGGAVLHVGLPTVRRVVAAELNRALADSFKGRVEVQG